MTWAFALKHPFSTISNSQNMNLHIVFKKVKLLVFFSKFELGFLDVPLAARLEKIGREIRRVNEADLDSLLSLPRRGASYALRIDMITSSTMSRCPCLGVVVLKSGPIIVHVCTSRCRSSSIARALHTD